MSMPKCKFCGRFLNPSSTKNESDIVYSMFEISHYVYWHIRCSKISELRDKHPTLTIEELNRLL